MDIQEDGRVALARTQLSHVKNIVPKVPKELFLLVLLPNLLLSTSWQYKFSQITKENISINKGNKIIPENI